ncbi:MAG: dihydropteroate synthase [Alphaproteobacteria bacterium]
MHYYRPIVMSDAARPKGALQLVGGALWFTHAQQLPSGEVVPVADIPADILHHLTSPREPVCGVDMQRSSIMGILNVTPDSFSDGGQNFSVTDAVTRAKTMLAEGADMIDIGGESTRPGADFVPVGEEINRTAPVIEALQGLAPISIDTRKPDVAKAANADLWNDVTALAFDPESLATAAALGVPVCIMHASGDPKTMQNHPVYDNVLLDVYDYLAARIAACEAAKIPRAKIMIDVGIGFGKTDVHNLELLRNISLFHGLGCPILLGVSRKSMIGRIGHAPNPADRTAGSIALALMALNQGVQILRVHDIAETKQAIRLWSAMIGQADDT